MSLIREPLPALIRPARPARNFPNADYPLFTRRCYVLAIGRPDQRIHLFATVHIDEILSPIQSIPDMDISIFTCSGNAPAIGRPGQSTNFVSMTPILRLLFLPLLVPHTHAAILARCSNTLPIW